MKTLADYLSPIHQIDGLAEMYAASRKVLSDRVGTLNVQLQATNRRFLPGIKSAAKNAAIRKAELEAVILAHKDLFEKPKTMTLHGIKIGFRKGVGALEWADDEKLSAAIEKQLPDKYEALVKVTRKPIAKALQSLAVAVLKKLGCTVEETGEFVIVKAADSEIDKLVAKLLGEGSKEVDAE